ncbi:MAG: hypothetical protein AB7O52_13565 [Planctomycetota bacterium]
MKLLTPFVAWIWVGFVAIATAPAGPPCPASPVVLASPSPGAGDLFGASLAGEAASLIVGSRGASSGGAPFAGSVGVFRLQAGQWVLAQQLAALTPSANEQFGFALSLDRDRLVVGAPNSDLAGLDQGAAFVFRRLSADAPWELEATLLPMADSVAEAFGRSVACEGSRIAIGAPQHPGGGRVYVFDRNPLSGQYEVTIPTLPGGVSRGFSMALSGARLVVGDPSAERVEVLLAGSTGWSLEQTLTDSSGGANPAAFGAAVAIRGTEVFVGAPLRDLAPGDDRGGVHRFWLDGDQWEPGEILISTDPRVQQLGRSLVTSEGLLVAGAPATSNHLGQSFVGGAVLFRRPPGDAQWLESDVFQDADGEFLDEAGSAVTVGPSFVALGAPLHDVPGAFSSGVVQVFARSEVDCDGNGIADFCELVTNPVADVTEDGVLDVCQQFRRGDVNASGMVSFPDVVDLLLYLFSEARVVLQCEDACDGNDDGRLNLADAVVLLNYLFLMASPPPPSPGPWQCGTDPTPDVLGCIAPMGC